MRLKLFFIISTFIFILVACSSGAKDELFLRVRPRTAIVINPNSDNKHADNFKITIFADNKKPSVVKAKINDQPYVLKLDEWKGEFIKVRFESADSVKPWKEINAGYDYITVDGLPPSKKPNVIIYVVDALRADRLGCYTKGLQTSPNIDAFAEESIVFKNAYSAASWTKASVASIFTGAYPPAHGAIDRDGMLDPKMPTIAELLKKNGYHTAAFVTNGNIAAEFGFNRGFDVFKYLPEEKASVIYASSEELLEKIKPELESLPEPFFLYIHQSDPHAPYTPPAELAKKIIPPDAEEISGDMDTVKKLIYRSASATPGQIKYLLGLYDGEVAAADSGFGKFLEILRQRNVYDNSMIFFTADHGEEFGEHTGFGHGGTLYKELINVPLIFYYQRDSKDPISNTPVSLADIAPTILSYLDILKPTFMKGTTLSNYDEKKYIKPLYFHEKLDKVEKEAVLDYPMMLIRNINLTNQWGDRVIEWEMYDLENDPLMQQPIVRGKNITRQVLEKELNDLRTQNAPKGALQKAKISPELRNRLRAPGYW